MSTLSAVLNWRVKTPFYYGWLVLGVVASGSFVATSIAGVVLGGIQFFIFEETGWSRSSIGLAAAAGVWCSGVVAPFAGRLTDRYGPRSLMPCGTIFLGLALLGLGWFHSLWYFYVATISARAVSQPLLIGVVPRTLAVNFFRRRRNTALALTGMFRPISGAIIIQIISIFALTFGWRTAFSYLGLLSLALTVPMLLVIRRRPEDIGLLPDGVLPNQTTAPSQAGSTSRTSQPAANPSGNPRVHPAVRRPTSSSEPGEINREVSWTARSALRTRAFWLVALTTMLSVTGSSTIGFSMVPYLHEEANISAAAAVGVLSLSTFLSLANLGWAYLADKTTPRWSMVIALIAAGGVVLYLTLVGSIVSAFAFGLLWGLVHSSLEVIVYMVLAQYFGRESYGAIAGALRPFEAGGLGLGQVLGPVIYDIFGSYSSMIAIAAALHFAAALLIFLARPPEARLTQTAATTGVGPSLP